MTTLGRPAIAALALVVAAGLRAQPAAPEDPQPRVVRPGDRAAAAPDAPPADAIVLFDGSSLDGFTHADGKQPAGWKVMQGVSYGFMECAPGSGSIISKHTFGDAQVHVEFATPSEVLGEGQGRGNSGVYLQGRYEVQVLDSFGNTTYPKGQCGAIYGQHAPLVNACRGPGEWQTYDIIFRAARFHADGTVAANATITVFHNGVLIHDHAEVRGTTGAAPGKQTPGDGPLYLQDHGNRVRYRNIWIRPL